MAPKVWNFYGFKTENDFKNQYNKKMFGGKVQDAPASTVGNIMTINNNRKPQGSKKPFTLENYPVYTLSQLTNTVP